MRKITWCLLTIALLAGGCLKREGGCGYSDSNIVAPQAEVTLVENYLANNSITATKHASGMYYQIVSEGSGTSPNLCSQVKIAYTGKFTNGTVFDFSSSVVYTLSSLIEGWKKGLPLIKKGGSIKLYIPPSLGYGAEDFKDRTTGAVIIPGNSVLIFDITLSDVG